jgi:hypothetical protein
MQPFNVKAAAQFVVDSSQGGAPIVVQLLAAVNNSDGSPAVNLGVDSFVVTDVVIGNVLQQGAQLPLVTESVQNIPQSGSPSAFYSVELSSPGVPGTGFSNLLLITVLEKAQVPGKTQPGQRPFFVTEVIAQGTTVVKVVFWGDIYPL